MSESETRTVRRDRIEGLTKAFLKALREYAKTWTLAELSIAMTSTLLYEVRHGDVQEGD